MFEHPAHTPGAIGRARSLRRRMNVPEKRLWTELRKLNAYLRRQAPIGRYVVDFASHARRLLVEVDGAVHERLPEVALRDVERTAWLESQGYRVVRFSTAQVEADLSGVVGEIERHLALPLDGGGLGGGASAEFPAQAVTAIAPLPTAPETAVVSPPSPTLPPSRGKGVDCVS